MENKRKRMEIQESKREKITFYRKSTYMGNIKVRIIDMIDCINEEEFLKQIYVILKRHIDKRGG